MTERGAVRALAPRIAGTCGRVEQILLLQLDGKLPNLALMRIARWHRDRGDRVVLRRAVNHCAIQPQLGDHFKRVYASAIFERTRPLVSEVHHTYPQAVIGGTGVSLTTTLSAAGIPENTPPDYQDYPEFQASLGFTQRGCRLRCEFCVVPAKEGNITHAATIAELWRGEPWPRHIHLLDNDFFGQPAWPARIAELRAGGFKVSFNQGINVRFLTPETAAAIASVDYRDDSFRVRRIYTAWDNRKDASRVLRGLELLRDAGVKPDHIMVYMLVGYWPGETAEDREHRRRMLRDFGARPYPMPYVRTPEMVGFARWVIGAYDKRIAWADWERANYRPERLGAVEGA